MKKHSIKLLLATQCVAVLFWADTAVAQSMVGSESVDYSPWLKRGELLLENLADRHSLPLNITIVKSFSGKDGFKLSKIKSKDFNKIGMLRLVDNEGVQFSAMFNKSLSAQRKQAKKSVTKSAKFLFGLSDADILLYSPVVSGENWDLSYNNGDTVEKLVDSRPPENQKDISALYEWVMNNLGYNGVILDQKDDLFLVTAPANLLKDGAQALVLGDTSEQVLVDQESRKGTALLKFVQSSGIFAILQVSFQKNESSLPKPGDKLSVSL